MTTGWLPALAASGFVAAAGLKAGALTARAALAATAIGAAILRGGGLRGGALLAAFFVSGSALPRFFPSTRRFKSDSARNSRQVIANGGAAACVASLAPMIGVDRALAGLAGSLAAATADTWATEIGSTSQQAPRLILSGRPVKPGLSGGVTRRGNLGAVAGACLIGVLAGLLSRNGRVALATAVAGGAGTLVDSVLGELAQAKYRKPGTGELIEAFGSDGPDQAKLVAGSRWIDNDIVNLACTLSGAAVALLIYRATER